MASDQAKRTDRRVLRTRKAIMNAYDKILSERGTDKVTVSAIAREAGIDRKTFYLHYQSIDDLTDFRTEEMLARVLGALISEGIGKPLIERIHIVLMEVNTIIMSNIAVYVSIAQQQSTDQIVDRFERAGKRALTRSGLSQEVLTNLQHHMRMQYYVAGGISLYTYWLRSDRSQPIEEISNAIEEAVLSLREGRETRQEER